MGGRYFITGTQLGMLIAFAENKDINPPLELLNEIEKNQYLGDKNEQEFLKLLKNKKKEV